MHRSALPPGTAPSHWRLPTLVEVARQRATAAPDEQAFTFLGVDDAGDQHLTNHELDLRARRIAAGLQDRGAGGSRVLIALDPGLDYIAALLGCLYAGAVATPVYPPDPYRLATTLDRLMTIYTGADCGLVLSSNTLLGGPTSGLRQLAPAATLAVDDLLAQSDAESQWTPPPSDPQRLAILQYTSGTTSTPRGVMLTFANLNQNLRAMEPMVDIDDAIAVHWLPPYHDMGLIGGVLLPIFVGRHTCLLSPIHFMQRPVRWLEAITRFRGTSTASPNFGYELCLRKISDADLEGLDLSSWRVAVSGAEPVRADTIERFTERFAPVGFRREAFAPAYGMAETTLMVSLHTAGEPPLTIDFDAAALAEGDVVTATGPSDTTRRLVGAGSLGDGVEVRIVDADSPVDAGVETPGVGEIWVRSGGVASGYWRDVQRTAATFNATLATGETGFLRTGDLGFLHGGELFVTGRRKELIILAGRNFFPHDIELAAQATHAALKRDGGAAVAIEVDNEERVVLFQEVFRPKRHDLAELAELARQAVVTHTLNEPHAVVLLPVGELPKTSSGKTRRAECLRAWQAGQLRTLHERHRGEHRNGEAEAGEREPLETRTEAWLAEVWCAALDLDTISRHENFFELGGQSLQVIEMLSSVADRIGTALPLKTLFDAPTLVEFAAVIDRVATHQTPKREPRQATAAEFAAEHPLTPAQQRFWLMEQFGPTGGANVPLAVRLRGTIDRERLQTALNQLVERHDALRIAITESSGNVLQRFVEVAPLLLQELPPPTQPVDDPVAWALDLPVVWQPFDLASAPIARVGVASLAEDDHVLLLVLHHAVADGASFATLMSDLVALYQGDRMSAVEWSFADALVNKPETSDTDNTGSGYWRDRLAGLPPATDLPFDRPATPPTLADIATTDLPLTPDLVDRIANVANAHDATPFMLYLAVWRTVLSRYTSDDPIGIGVAVAGRDHATTRRTVGCFINTLPLAGESPSASDSFGDLLAHVRQTTLADLDHAAVPWEVIAAGAPRVPGRMPVVQAFFLYDDQGPLANGLSGSDLCHGGLNVTAAATDYRGLGVYDATLIAEVSGREPRLRLVHDRRLIGQAAAHRMLASCEASLAAVVCETPPQANELPIPASQELATAIVTGTARSLAADADPLAWFLDQAAKRPDSTAIDCGGKPTIYRDLANAAACIAARLAEQGVAAGDRVGVMTHRSADAVAALLGVWQAGAAYVPLDPTHPAERLRHMATDAELACLIVDDDLLQLTPECDAPKLRLSSLVAGATNRPITKEPIAASLAYVMYTSGSTGKPKGVAVPRRAVANLLRSFANEIGFQPGDTLLAATTFSFDISVLELFLPLAFGGRVVLADSSTVGDPSRLVALIRDTHVDYVQGTPSTFRMLLGEGWRPASGQGVLCGGEPLTPDIARPLHAATDRLWNVYGPTETTIWSTVNKIEDPTGAAIIGRPIDNTTCVVLGRDRTVAPIGVWGELAIGGDGLAAGYWHRAELTAERFVELPPLPGERFYLTGDIVRLRDDGRFEFRGRNDQQVKVRGHRIELREIEAALTELDTVSEAVVVVQSDPQGLTSLVACFVPTGCQQPTPAELRSELGRRLPDSMLPSAFAPMSELPRTSNGKLDRNQITEMCGETIARPQTLLAPRTPLETRLATWWCELLRVDRVGTDESFFEIGGHSLLAMQVMVRVRDELRVELPLRDVYERPTIAAWSEMIVAAQLTDLGKDINRLAAMDLAERSALEVELLEQATATASASRIPVCDPARRATLSFAERRLWFLDRLEPQHAFYNMPLAARVTGPLDRRAFAAALQNVVDRHETLRYAYRINAGEPIRTIYEQVTVAPQWVDLRDQPADAVALDTMLREEARQPFDLSTPPLLRCVVYELSDDERVVLLLMHHIVSDGWSMWVMMGDLADAYRQALGGGEELSLLDVQYSDYAVWQHDQAGDERMAAAEAFWREQLADAPPLLELPTDRPRGAEQDFDGSIVPFALDPAAGNALRALAERLHATPFMVLMAAYQAWLARHTGQHDLCVGTAIAGRDRAELERLVGFFVNTLAIRTDLSDDPTFDQLVDRVRATSLAAFKHSVLPFELIVEAVAPDRARSHAALFQSALVVQNPPRDFDHADGLRIDPRPVDNGTAKYDLTFQFWEEADRWVGQIEYRTSLFDRETIERFATSFRTLLADGLAAPGTRISQLAVLDADQRRQLDAFNDTTAPLDEPLLVHENVARIVDQYADKVAIRFRGQSTTYAELWERSGRVAAALAERGVKHDTPVIVSLGRSTNTVVAMLGVWRAGGVFVPLPPDQATQRLGVIQESTGAEIVINEQSICELLTPSPRPETSSSALPNELLEPTTRCYVIFTSGSTGEPKGVEVEHRSIVNFFRALANRMQVTASDRVLHGMSIAFDGGLAEMLLALSTGATMVIAEDDDVRDPKRFTQLLRDEHVSAAKFPPALLPVLDPAELPEIRVIAAVGDALSAAVAEPWAKGRRMINGYGPTEATVGLSLALLDEPVPARPPIGGPIANTRAYVLDANRHRVPIGVAGEIWIGGVGVARGYLGDPAKTAERFYVDPFVDPTTNPWDARMYRTGDIGRWLPNGELEFLGRVDEQVQLRGYRVEPGEVTAALERLPQVDQAIVVARPDDRGAPRLVAYVVAGEHATAEQDPVDGHLDQWRSLMDQSQAAAGALRDAEFDITGWTSTFTGRPIPKAEMRAWSDATIERVLALKPRKVLEIGCGTGIVLLQVAPHCEHYVGTDFLSRSIDQLRGVVSQHDAIRNRVELHVQAAHEIGALAGKRFDTIVLNSVVQYFPSVDYLLDVLRLVVPLVAPGGKLFLGDVRNRGLHEALAAAVEIERAEPGVARRELLGRIEARLRREEELLLDPALFDALPSVLPRLSWCETELKQGEADNELIRYRYDTVLHFDDPPPHYAARETAAAPPQEVLASLSRRPVAVRDVANPRVTGDLAAWHALQEAGDDLDVGMLKQLRASNESSSIHPDAWRTAAAEQGLACNVRWSPVSESAYEVELTPLNIADNHIQKSEPHADSSQSLAAHELSCYANRPLEEKLAAKLVPELRATLAESLPAYMIPASFVVLDELPKNRNGKVDRDALPAPPPGRPAWAAGFVAPRDEEEKIVARVWEELLGVTPIGANDNFFEMGGHSMLAVQVMAQIEEQAGHALPLATLFQEPTVARLAALVRDPQAAGSAGTLVPLQTTGDGEPLFCVHPAGGTVFCYQALAAHFADERPVFGVQATGVDGLAPPHESVAEMAKHYAAAIRRQQPTGQIHLAGWSIGGNLAYAVACELAALGAEVGLVALFDAGVVPADESVSENDLAPLLTALFPDQDHLPIDELRELTPDEQVAYFTERAARAGLVDPQQLEANQHVFAVFQQNVEALHRHTAEPYAGRVTLFRAAEQSQTSALVDDRELGWGAVAGAVDVFDVPSDHAQMMNPPQVDTLAEQLKQQLMEFV